MVAKSLEVDQYCDVPVELVPEAMNPYDKKAIAFVCIIDKKQHRIGYIVRECLDAVHDALSSNVVKSAKFVWCKYRTFNGHLGFYAAVNITKFGNWPNVVYRSRSTYVDMTMLCMPDLTLLCTHILSFHNLVGFVVVMKGGALCLELDSQLIPSAGVASFLDFVSLLFLD